MMKHVHLVGNRGNMAQRYYAILKYLDPDIVVTGHDLELDLRDKEMAELYNHANGFIICTPTERHLLDLEDFLFFKKPILCEKPLTRDSKELKDFLEKKDHLKDLITMVDQYKYIAYSKINKAETSYNYFKSGNDGIAWDCINIIGKALGPISLKNDSPFWQCQINGEMLRLHSMDFAYVDMIRDWITNPKGNMDYALEAHQKVDEFLRISKKQLDTTE